MSRYFFLLQGEFLLQDFDPREGEGSIARFGSEWPYFDYIVSDGRPTRAFLIANVC